MTSTNIQETMFAMRRKDWWSILGVSRSASRAEIEKRRRCLQKEYHTDRGGNHDMSAMINLAADSLLANSEQKRCREEEDRKEEEHQMRKEEEERQERLREERARLVQAMEEQTRRDLEEEVGRQTAALSKALRLSTRGNNNRQSVNLGKFVGAAFPNVSRRLAKLHSLKKYTSSRALAFAAIRELMLRRTIQEITFPKARNNPKLLDLARLYKNAKMMLSHRIRKNLPTTFPSLVLNRIRREAWELVMQSPPLLISGPTIALPNHSSDQ